MDRKRISFVVKLNKYCKGDERYGGDRSETTIKTLFKKGCNKTQIANILGIDRKTVRTILQKIEKYGEVKRKEYVSILDPHKEYINIQVSK